jgi:hypothetical protein
MCSPASRHGRQETVFTFAAEKSSDVEAAARHKALPDWIVTGKEPVPLLHEQQKLMTRQEAEPALRTFLTRMYDDSERNSGF